MLKLKVRDEQISYVKNLLKTKNFGRRGDGSKKYNNGNKEEQFVGILGEVVVADLFGQPRPGNKETENDKKGDGGVDLIIHNQKIDIKTMGRNCSVKDYFVHNLYGEQVGKYYKNNIYIFTSLNKQTMELTICGWVTKTEFFRRANFYPYGSIRKNPQKSFKVRSKKGLYEIRNNKLNAFYSKKRFCDEMNRLKNRAYRQKKRLYLIKSENLDGKKRPKQEVESMAL